MSGVNKVILLGNLGSEVKMRNTGEGRKVGSVNIATSEVWRDQQGEKKQHTEWHRLTFFGRQAEIASQYMRKGSQVFIEGKLRTRTWKDPNTGADRYTTEVNVLQFQMVGARPADSDRSAPPQRKSREPEASASEAEFAEGGNDLDNIREDIPW